MPSQDETHEGLKDRIRSERNRLGLTQDQLADDIGVHKMTVVKWESGVQTPRPAEKEKLAARFGRTPVWLHYGEAGVSAAIDEEIAAAETRGYERAMQEVRERLIRAVEDATSARTPEKREERPEMNTGVPLSDYQKRRLAEINQLVGDAEQENARLEAETQKQASGKTRRGAAKRPAGRRPA